MESIRKWFYRPKRDDTSLLAQFFYADESLNAVACELDSFDGRQEPERCTTLVNQLRHCQDKVLTICNQIMDELIPESRANRDFRVKFPDDVMQENLAGQLWFGAECLAAGSSIMNREAESSAMRPLAKALTKSLELVRNLLREHALKGHMNLKAQNQLEPSIEKLIESLKIFDRLFADFELCYVGAMVPVKSTKEYEQQELVCVLFSETLQRALERGLLSQSDVDNYEPALMFTIPRLAIVAGLLAPPGGPLCLNSPDTISEMFRPFRNLLLKIRELLWTLNNRELYMLEKLLCSNEEPSATSLSSQSAKAAPACQELPDVDEFVHNFYTDYPNCKDFIVDFYTITRNTGANMDETANDAVRILDEESGRIEYLIERRLQPERREKRARRSGAKSRVHEKSTRSSSTRGHSSTNISHVEDDSRLTNSRVYEDSTNPSIVDSTDGWIHSRDCQLESFTLDTNYEYNGDNLADRQAILLSRDATRIHGNSIEPGQNEVTRQEDFTNPDITRILGAQTDIIEIPQTQYLLNQVSHENQVTGETHNIENSLPDMDSQKLISEANKTLSSLLLETSNATTVECHNNEISEQTDSGICTVISSENTSLYDKSPEEKKTFANELGETESRDEDKHENTSYSCSSLTSQRRDDTTATPEASPCVCNNTRATWSRTDNRPELSNNRVSRCVGEQLGKSVTRISSSFNGTSEEFIGVAYGNGQISVCDSNPSTLQINYSENWETLMNRGIERTATTTTNAAIRNDSDKPEFRWSGFECKNCPSTSQREITKIGDDIERYARVRIAARRGKEAKIRKRTQRKFERRAAKRSNDDVPPRSGAWSHIGGENMRANEQLSTRTRLTTASSESSRSNSTDRCLSPRLVNFGASLHPSRNTRQMPNFGGHSPQPSPRLCHFEARADTSTANCSTRSAQSSRIQSAEKYAHNRKLLDHRRSRSEQIARIKRTTTVPTECKRSAVRTEPETEETKLSLKCDRSRTNDELMNDGLGPRTDKSGLAAESPSPPPLAREKLCTLHDSLRDENDEDIEQPRPAVTKAPKLACANARTVTPKIELSVATRCVTSNNAPPTSSSCSSCCDSSSSETSEFQSDCQDDEEIALAMQAAEIANRNQIRAKFRSSEDLVHRLFVCIAGVADQLQTNFASDLRNILKCVFLMNSSQIVETTETTKDEDEPPTITTPSNESLDIQTTEDTPDTTETSEAIIERPDSLREDDEEYEETTPTNERSSPMTECGEECIERAPAWVPDNDAPRCMACQAGFTVVRRRHHCRNCGKVFCGRCSSNNVPLPRYGHTKPVRVCNRCFIYQVMPFTVSQVTTTS